MDSLLAAHLGKNLSLVSIYGILAIFTLLIAYKSGFFFIKEKQSYLHINLSFRHLIFPFVAYFISSFIITPIFAHWFNVSQMQENHLFLIINFINAIAILLFFLIFFLIVNAKIRKDIWLKKPPFSIRKDLFQSALCWLIALPVIVFFNQIFELLKASFFKKNELPDQIAVYFLKKIQGNIPLFLFAALLVIFIVPIIEEILFRGILQTFLRKFLSIKPSILISSLCFAFFHYSPMQGLANIMIIGSLFIFALFLGFVYEKRGSLFAAISLHGIFNMFTIINLIFIN